MLFDPEVKSDADRARWEATPHVNVGPLHFGMSHSQVVSAMSVGDPTRSGYPVPGEFASFYDAGVTVYYGEGGLTGVAISPFRGPRIFLGDFQLSHRLPSEIARWMEAGAAGPYRVNQRCEPYFEETGLLIRGQQGGDFLRSRPVFVGCEWPDRFGDLQDGSIPAREWEEY
ncbi:peroxidase [Streptomyces varsoviensis]|uniref:hypothetical protein n=1 Tax=Streptomyces varsoviensis TaxID=67373 RepID=UPI0012FF06F8|nr:hypothetical protein [Streptomyces varsoviensis]